MNTASLLKKTAIEPENIIGTKWIGWNKSIGDRMTIEFVDKKNCVYTLKPNKYPMTYTVTGDNIFISNIVGPLELMGNVLFINDIPILEKAAQTITR